MQRRRDRILTEARRLITEQGFDALSTRALARAAGVTAPTLYNLIGGKDQILEALELAAVAQLEAQLGALANESPLAMAEAIATESVALFEADQAFFQAAVVAADRLSRCAGEDDALTARAVELARRTCDAALDEGLLRGNIAAATLAEQMYAAYRLQMHDWGHGAISLDVFAERILRGFYLILAADAVPKFRNELLRRLSDLDARGSGIDFATNQHANGSSS